MGLSLYNKKRNFSETAEPKGKEKKGNGTLRFVVQKHDASSLHYDFRLEMDGVLKSWAVPKGPSLNPKDKRLAMMVEDHPYDYRTFEGVIPEGNYGAGVVIVWDEGVYEAADEQGKSRKEQQASLLQQLADGNLHFILHGHKLKGEYALVKMKNGGEKAWMLIKKKDTDASTTTDVTEDEISVLSGKTLAQIAAENNAELHHPQAAKKGATKTKAASISSIKKALAKKKALPIKEALSEYGKGAVKAPMPKAVKPMLATLVEEPFDNKDWLFEIKWDGYRAVSYLHKESVEVISRNMVPFTQKYQPVTDALQQLGINAVVDGEIVAVDEKGLAVFQLLQNWQNRKDVRLQYYVFDLLWLDGYDVTGLPLLARKQLLQQLIPPDHETIKYSDHVIAKGKDFFRVAIEQGLEGIMAKKIDSLYQADSRSSNWLKIKVNKRQEVIIAGFTAPRNSRKFFGALLLGVYQGNELVYIGHTGSGFNRKSLEAIWHKLQPLTTDHSPFAKPPKTNMPATWVKPELVCEIKFTEWTAERQARHPIFMGLREDKNSKEVTIEKTTDMPAATRKSKAAPAAVAKKTKTPAAKKQPAAPAMPLDKADGKDQTITIENQELKVTNLNKLYWKKEGYTKGDLINYYLKVAPYILPYITNRPQSLSRFPNGIDGTHFFQKDVKGKVPDWIQTFEFYSESTDETIDYLVCNGEASLVYMANLGCIEIHPWHSTVQAPEHPVYCLIDLDPDKNKYDDVVTVAQVVKKILDAVNVPCYCKTSGSTGMHICIPLGAKYQYDQSKQLAELIVTLVHKELPALTSLERNPDKRKGKVYLDFLQNAISQTVAAPYSLRPKRTAPVSTPLHWDEVKKGITATLYTMTTIFDRLKSEGDLFRPVIEKGIDLKAALQKIERHFL